MDREHQDKAGEQEGDTLGNREYRFKDAVSSDIKPNWKNSAQNLKDAEQNAGKKTAPISDQSTAGSGNAAENAVPSFTNNVKGKDDQRWDKNSPFNKAFPQVGVPRQLMKKFGPVGLIAGLIIAGAFAIFGSQAILPFHVVEMLVEDFNSLEVGTNLRAKNLTKHLLNDRTDPTRQKLFSFNKLKYKNMSSKRQAALKNQGIEIYDKGTFPLDADGSPDANLKRIADTDSLDDLLDGNRTLSQRIMLFDDGSGVKRVVTAGEFEAFFNQNPNFRNGYLKGSRTWSGRIAGWFDKLAVRFLSKWGVTRNLFKDYIANVTDREAGNRAFVEAMASKGKAGEMDLDGATGSDKDAGTEENPDATRREVLTSDNEIGGRQSASVDNTSADKAAARAAAAESFKTKISAIAGASDLACGVMLGVAAIGALSSALELAKLVDYASSFTEATQKAQAGEGDGSPVHEFSNILTEPAVLQDINEDNKIYDVEGAAPKTAMEASGMAWSTTGSPANQNGVSETRYSMEGALKGFRVAKDGLVGCMAAKAIAAVASIAITVGTLGIGALVKSGIKALGKVFVKFAGKVVLASVTTLTLGALLPKLANVFAQDLVSDIHGEDVGNALVSGAHAYQSNNHQTGGGSPADSAEVLAFRQEQRKVIAMNAELDRQTHSPFDVSNKNTFFGSIFNKALPFFGHFPTLSKTLSSFGSVAKQSVAKLLPTADAFEDAEFNDNRGDCPALNSIGAEGDIYCQPYFVSDVSTKAADPDAIMEKVYSMSFQAPNKWLDGKYGERQHNFILETDRCDELYESKSYNIHGVKWSRYYQGSEMTMWGGCLDRAESDGVDNIIPSGYDGDVLRATEDPETGVLRPDYPEGNEQIKTGSNLYAYIVFCSNRGSTFGTNDANIIDEFLNPIAKSPVASTVVGLVPVAGEIMDLVEAEQTTEALDSGWVYGENCVATNKPIEQPELESELESEPESKLERYWESEMVYYQQYIEDNRIVENMGGFDDFGGKSPVVAMLEEYEKTHPVDNTFEGYLARASGLKKEEVEKYLAVMNDYLDGKLEPTYISSLYPAPYGWGSAKDYEIKELNTQKTVLAKALKKFDSAKTFSMTTFSENRRKWVVDLV
jgi:hypothetical protein